MKNLFKKVFNLLDKKQKLSFLLIILILGVSAILSQITPLALDNTSEKYVQKEIEKLASEYGATIISIAHRLTTLQNCDEIIVIDKGEICQRGTYDELSSQPGIFQDMKNGVLR